MPIRSRSSQNLFRDRLSRVYIASSNYQIFHLSKDIFFFFSTQDEQFLENIASIFLLAEK